MKILAFDTSSKTAYAALAEAVDGKVKKIADYSYLAPSHTVALTRMTESILTLAGWKFDDIDFYAVSVGPGSFTGVRIGVSLVKGFALPDGKPCVGVSSLEALAYGCPGLAGIVAPMIDARRSTCYTAVFSSDGQGNITRLEPDAQLEAEKYTAKIASYATNGKRLILVGDGSAIADSYLAKAGITPDIIEPDPAYGACVCAYNKWRAAEDKSAYTDMNLLPVYLKKSQAEREREEKLAAENNIK